MRGIVLDRLARHLGPEAAPTKHVCLRCGLILDPLILGHHTASREHRAHKDPWLEPVAPLEAVPAPIAEPEPRATTERFTVAMEPLLISAADAARVLGLSRSTIGELAVRGTIPSRRVGSRVLLPVEALEERIEARLAEDAERFAASWSRLGSHVTSTRGARRVSRCIRESGSRRFGRRRRGRASHGERQRDVRGLRSAAVDER